MGYSYGYNYKTGRYDLLSCDSCGKTKADGAGVVRKRACTFKVPYRSGANIFRLNYCPPPALCSDCYAKHGKAAGIHAGCADGAAASVADFEATEARYAAGDAKVFVAYGDWKDEVPSGMVLVGFRDLAGTEVYKLIPDADYKGGGWLTDYATAADTALVG